MQLHWAATGVYRHFQVCTTRMRGIFPVVARPSGTSVNKTFRKGHAVWKSLSDRCITCCLTAVTPAWSVCVCVCLSVCVKAFPVCCNHIFMLTHFWPLIGRLVIHFEICSPTTVPCLIVESEWWICMNPAYRVKERQCESYSRAEAAHTFQAYALRCD